jgi:hypothetical protein
MYIIFQGILDRAAPQAGRLAMTEERGASTERYDERQVSTVINRLRRRWAWLWVWLLLAAPSSLASYGLTRSEAVAGATGMFCAFVAWCLGIANGLTRCPRCKAALFIGAFWVNPYSRRCVHCGLRLDC